jgi:glycosyltransferase involved in cell wall biosynthesis
MCVVDREAIRPVVVCLNEVRQVSQLRELGITVHVLADPLFSRHVPRWRRLGLSKLRRVGIRLNRPAPWLFPWILRRIHAPTINAIADLARQEEAAWIHLNVQTYRDFFGVVAAVRAGLPCISHLRSADPGLRGQFNPIMARYANDNVSAFVANSVMTRDYWIHEGLDQEKMHVVLNGIEDRNITGADVRERWGLEPGTIVIGVVAPLRNPLKIDEFTIRVFAKILENYPQAVLLIIGDGPMGEILAREAARLGISEKVILTGFQSDAKEILAGMDASLILNNHDSFSRVAIESLQVGTPLIATDIGGIREIILDRENGLLVPYGDEAVGANALVELQRDETLRMRLIENGLRSVRTEFSVERYAGEIAALHTAFAGNNIRSMGNETN